MYQPPRGTRDFLPEEMYKRNWVLDRIREVYETYGFEPLGTPAFESWELLKFKSGMDVIDQIYYFKDKSDRELGLRFEWTASLARVIATHRELQMPFKRYAIGPVWRYENPSEKRYREFWQADADVVGVGDPIADSEVLATAVSCLKKLGFKGFIIRLNDRRILEAFIKRAEIQDTHILDTIRVVDKLAKIGRDAVIGELSKLGIQENDAKKLLDDISLKGSPKDVLQKAREELKDSPKGLEGCLALEKMAKYAEKFGYSQYLIVELNLARGLDYYTGPVFEVSTKEFEDYGSIAGGGRYDEIIGLFGGSPVPATGISFGIDRLVPLLEMKHGFKGARLGVSVLVLPTSEKLQDVVIEIAQELRDAGVATLLDLLGRRVSKQLEYANKKQVSKVVIIGEKEFTEGCVIVRDMITGEQVKIERKNLLSYIRSYCV